MSHFEASVTNFQWDNSLCPRLLRMMIFGIDVARVIPYHIKLELFTEHSHALWKKLIKFVFEASVTNQIMIINVILYKNNPILKLMAWPSQANVFDYGRNFPLQREVATWLTRLVGLEIWFGVKNHSRELLPTYNDGQDRLVMRKMKPNHSLKNNPYWKCDFCVAFWILFLEKLKSQLTSV